MADQHQVNQSDPDIIRLQMEQTRSSLAEKLEVLEKKVTDTVLEATEAVSETVESVKETVTETVTTVKDTVTDTVGTVKETLSSTVDSVYHTLDLRAQVEEHPLIMFGGSIAVGFLSGWFLGGATQGGQTGSSNLSSSSPSEPVPAPAPAWSSPSSRGFETPAARSRPSWFDRLTETFGSEIDKLKGMAIGTLGSVVRDVLTQNVPPNVQPMITDLIQSVTTKLGGEMIPGRVLPEAPEREHSTSGVHV